MTIMFSQILRGCRHGILSADFSKEKGSCLLGLMVLGEVGDAGELCGYTILESCQRYGVDRNQTECSVFERLLSSFSWEAGFEPHVLFEVVVKRFIGIPLGSIPSGASFDSTVIYVNLLVPVVGANPFIVSLLVEETEFRIKISVDFEIMVFPIGLISMVDVIKITERVVHPVLLRFVEEICSKTVFCDRDILVTRVSAINGILTDMDVDLLKHGQVHG
jgi:hypothetical protein